MTNKELCDLLDYIQKNNSWENMYYLVEEDRYVYKYVDIHICYDTRDTNDGKDPHIWYITLTLRECGKRKEFRESECTFENIKKFLDKPIKEAIKEMEEIPR